MAGIASVGSVGAGLNEAQFQVQYQMQALKDQQNVIKDVGAASLALIRAAFSSVNAVASGQEHDLDVLA